VQTVNAGAIARACDNKADIPQRVHSARVAAVKEAQSSAG
jgi:tRNA nucleotidyltransferase (CCA-adding enzyme)